MSRVRNILLGSLLLWILGGGGCAGFIRQNRQLNSHPLPATPTLGDVVTLVNDNSGRIRSLYSTDASVHIPMLPALRVNLAMERPRRLRLRAETGVTGAEIDLGSNDTLFWAWVRRMEPPTTFYCRHDQFSASPLRQFAPVEPDWIVDALGVNGFDPAGENSGPFPIRRGRLEVRTVLRRPEGPLTKITVVDAAGGWILEQHLYDTRGTRIASSLTSSQWRDPASGAVVPRRIEIQWPTAGLSARLDLHTVEVNRLGGDPALLFELPDYPGSAVVDMGDPSFRPPLAAAPTAPAAPPVAAQPRRFRLFR
ncbi:MAG TPA: hypothetical protein VHY20_08570 [Pirellulales bacterium]|nr:hypothetical protein [Pirellulales bacterium]